MDGPIVSLLTDFGAGVYVAQVKAVLIEAAPRARLVDVAHDLPAHSIAAAELTLRSVAFTFPAGSVHLVVVDPGVGTKRRPIAVAARERLFVGPDNGVLGIAVAEPGAQVVVLDNDDLFRHPVAPTFHGRDIFAPVAAALANQRPLTDVGTVIDDPFPSTLPRPRGAPGRLSGESLGADRFGNLLTNLSSAELRTLLGTWRVAVDGTEVEWYATYGDAEPGALIALEGSDGFVEVAVRDGSAAARLGRDRGISIECRAAGS